MNAAQVGEPVVELDRVGFRYGTGPSILSDVTLDLMPRSFHFLSGPSGAGKSTFLRLLMLAVRPTWGRLRVFGQDPEPHDRRTELRRRMGVVFQDFRLLDHMSIYGNVALPLVVRGYEEATYRGELVELLQWVGLGDRIASRPSELSGGEKQRAAIARALISRPDLILADEPTGNVDGALARRLLHLFVELNRLGTSVVFATHDLDLMDQVEASRLILVEGRIYQDP